MLNSLKIKHERRCPWVKVGDVLYEHYHDKEWGVPVHTDRKMFEFLVLESAQAGLSWLTVLRKRENYRRTFADFDVERVAKFDKRKIESLLKDEGIIRNKQKVAAAVNNAERFLKVRDEFGTFSKYIWSFVGGKAIVHKLKTIKDYPETIPEADALAKDMKKRGFKFFGPKITYAHMQATGLVNDHVVTCFRYGEIKSKV